MLSDEEWQDLSSVSSEQPAQQPTGGLTDEQFADINNYVSPKAPPLMSADEAQAKHEFSAVEALQALYKGTKAAAAGVKEGIQQTGESVVQWGLKLGDLAGIVKPETVKGYTAFAQAEQAARALNLPRGSEAGQILGKMLPYMAMSPAAGGGVLATMGKGAADLALKNSAFTFTPEGDSELGEAAIGGALGAVPGAAVGAGKLINRGVQGVKNMFPTKAGAQQAVGDIMKASGQSVDDLERGIAEANKQGIKVTTGEALNNPTLLAKEGQIVSSPERQLKAIESLKGRPEAAIKAVGKEMNQILPQGVSGAKKQLTEQFANMAPNKIDQGINKALLEKPVVLNNYNKVLKDADWMADKFPEGSVGRWHEVIQYISNKIDKSQGAVNKNLIEAKNSIMNAIEKSSPEYRDFMDLSQRVILKNKYVTVLRDQLKPLKGADKVSATQIYNNFFKDNKATRDIIQSLNRQGMDSSGVKAIVRTLNKLNNSKIDKLITKNPEFSTALSDRFGVMSRVSDTIDEAIRSRYYDELLELALNPEYTAEVLKGLRASDTGVLTGNLLKLLKKAGEAMSYGAPKAAAAATGNEVQE